jgi:hypothetical protein
MAPPRTAEDLRKPLPATSCASGRKILWSSGALFTASAQSATINHNNLDTRELLALILGTPRAGFESEFLLRARRGSEADRRGAQTIPAALLEVPQSISLAVRAFFRAAPSHRRDRSSLHRLLAPLTRGRKE